MPDWLYVGTGGFAGSVARYYFGGFVNMLCGMPRLPAGTLAVNVLGCFLIGALSAVASVSALGSPAARLLLITGFLGGFTTFSAFGYETFFLLRTDGVLWAAANVAGQLGLGLAAVWAGYRIFAAPV